MHGLRGSLRRQRGGAWAALLQQQPQPQQHRALATSSSSAPRPRAPAASGGAGAGKRRPLPSPTSTTGPAGGTRPAAAPITPAAQRLLEEAEAAALQGRTKAAMVLLEEAMSRGRGLHPAQAYPTVLRVLEAAAARPLAVATLGHAPSQQQRQQQQLSSSRSSSSRSSSSRNDTGIAGFFEGPGAWYDAPNFFRLGVLACNRAGSPREAARLLKRMRVKRLPVSAQAYSNVVHAAAEAGEDALCLEVLGELRRGAKAQQRHGQGAEGMEETMDSAKGGKAKAKGKGKKELRLVVSIRDYLCGLRACGRRRDAAGAQALLAEIGEQIEAMELPLHGSLYAAGIEALLACGEPEAAVALLAAMDRRVQGGALMLPFAQLKALVMACAEAGHHEAARTALAYVRQPALLEALEPELRAVAPALTVAGLLASAPAPAPLPLPVANAEEQQQQEEDDKGEEKGEQQSAAGRSSRTSRQPRTQQQGTQQQQQQQASVGLGEDAGPEEYRQALGALVDKGRPGLAQRVLRLMRSRGLALETSGVDAVLQAHLKAGAFAAAWALLQEVRGPAGGGWRPEASTYHVMLKGCDRGARGREAVALVEQAEAGGIALPSRTLAAAACACAKARETVNARRLLARMEEKGFPVPLRCWLELAESEARAGKGPQVLEELVGRGVPPTLRLHVVCGLPARALGLFDAQGAPADQPPQDVAMAMAAAGQLKDPQRVVALLAAAEANPALGTELARDLSVVTNACRALGGVVSGEDERACAEAILRFLARHGLARVDVGLVLALRDQGRPSEARGLVERWAARRLALYGDEDVDVHKTVQATGMHSSGPAYSAAINALGALGAWPVAHYLYDEALLRFRGRSAGSPAFLRALVLALTEGPGDLGDEGQEAAAALRRAMAMAAYRQAVREGWVSHWGPSASASASASAAGTGGAAGDTASSSMTMDVHRFPFRLAAVAVESVLEDFVVAAQGQQQQQPQPKGRRGGQGQRPSAPQQPNTPRLPRELWVVTGVGKHVNAPGQAAGQRTLRDRLAGYLAEAHGLLSREDLAYLAGRQDAAAGRIRIKGAALRAWVDGRRRERRRG